MINKFLKKKLFTEINCKKTSKKIKSGTLIKMNIFQI